MKNLEKDLTKEEILQNLYIHTTRKVPHGEASAGSKSFIYDFYGFSGIFYYYENLKRIDIDKDIMDSFSISIEEMIASVNSSTYDDYVLMPSDRPGVFKLFDKNGDSLERILLNNEKLGNYLRTLNDGYGLFLYPAKSHLWYLSVATMPEDREIMTEDFEYIKEHASADFKFFFKLDSLGEIQEHTQIPD